MAKEYVQTVKPASRIAERIFGWLGWLILLAIAAGLLFFSLVYMNDQATIDQFTSQMETELANQNLQGTDPQAVIDMTIDILGNFWAIALYLALPLIVAILGLVNMKRRILAGILLLIAAILAAPLFVTLISSLFFVIAAILLFARKDTVIKHDATPERESALDNNYRDRQAVRHEDEDVKRYENESDNSGYVDETTSNDDIESTRKFDRIDESDYQQNDTREHPTTDKEYDYNNESKLDDFDDIDREDPSQTRRNNVDRRNRE
ncbi:DUF4064 domain-containing protein [Jeotgalicoccus huakuii]|nr:DUF4064 domain-containing protein [Jeotgalicoccus huakuii]